MACSYLKKSQAEADISTSDSLPRPDWRQLLTNPVHLLAFGFGSGLSPRAPGTCGTAVAMVAMPLLAMLDDTFSLAFVVAVILVGVPICAASSRQLGVHDHPGIVWDEFAGYWLGVLWVPADWGWWLYGFVVFRLFDILKPWPIRWVDRQVHGGLGIMLDDVLAGLFTLTVLQASLAVLP